MAGKEFRNFEPCSGIACRTGLRIQIVIKRNEMRAAKAIFTFRYHRRRIAPDAHLPIVAKFTDDSFECCDSLGVVFEKKQRFHLSQFTPSPSAPAAPREGRACSSR